MKTTKLALILAGLCAGALYAGTLAAQGDGTDIAKAALGRTTFRSLCVSCHGPEAKGDGPVAKHLSPKPADLTQISARNQGTFPAEKVHRMIDAREPVAGHGTKDMPVWGDALRQLDNVQSEADVQKKITELTEYLRSIQK